MEMVIDLLTGKQGFSLGVFSAMWPISTLIYCFIVCAIAVIAFTPARTAKHSTPQVAVGFQVISINISSNEERVNSR